jgi:hypothetical protein
VERNDQVAGTKGSDVRTTGECVGTRYGVIYIGSEGNEGKPSGSEAEARELDSGMDTDSRVGSEAEAREPDSGNRT